MDQRGIETDQKALTTQLWQMITMLKQVMAAPLKISSKMSRVEDTVRRYDSVIATQTQKLKQGNTISRCAYMVGWSPAWF